MSGILNWIKTNHVAAGAIMVLAGVGVAGNMQDAQAWITAHQGIIATITSLVGIAGSLWKTQYSKTK